MMCMGLYNVNIMDNPNYINREDGPPKHFLYLNSSKEFLLKITSFPAKKYNYKT